MAKKVVFSDLPISQWQAGDTVAVFRNGKVVRIPVFGEGDIPDGPKLAAVATSGKYSDLTGRPILGTAASKNEGDFATADQGSKGESAYLWGNHALAGYAPASAVTAANIKTLYESNPDTNAFTNQQKADLESVFSWGDHRMQGYVLSADGRLSNAREWTASIISQSEAEAGTAATARKWTAQRVRQAVLAWWAGSDDKAKLDGVAAGATKNATDAQLRDRSTHTGIQAISTVSGLQTALDGKVDNSDSRLTNSREWTGATVSQAEAEAGTATTARKWTAQRVRQAIQAWFLTISGTFGRTILGRNTSAEVRSDLGLGTAATRNVGTGSGNLMEVGAFGLGGTLTYNPDVTLEAQHINGFGSAHHGNRSPSDSPDNVIGKVLYVGSASWGTQLWFSYYEGKAWFRNKETGKPYESWKEFIHSGNLQTTTGQSTSYPMTQKAVTDALATKANTTTQVIAGTGLTGGGTLAANRTLSVNYGTTAGTAAQGNDARLSNAREWTAAEVSQAEAEAGTATNARKWSALRVRQNVAAYTYSKSEIDDKIDAGGSDALTLAQAQAIALYF